MFSLKYCINLLTKFTAFGEVEQYYDKHISVILIFRPFDIPSDSDIEDNHENNLQSKLFKDFSIILCIP